LAAAAARPPGGGRQVAKQQRKSRSPKYSYDALRVLQMLWAATGGQCGRYLAESMRLQLDRHRCIRRSQGVRDRWRSGILQIASWSSSNAVAKPVTHHLIKNPPLISLFPTLTYALAYLLVTSARDLIDSSLLIPNECHRFAGINS
jgi:hypothetical protein